MARERISMSRGEVLDFLKRQEWAMVVSLSASGGPTGDIGRVALEGETLFLGVGPETTENLRRDPRVCCANDEYPTYYEIKGVTAHGRAREVSDPVLRRRVGLEEPDLSVFALELDDVLSFDFARIEKKT